MEQFYRKHKNKFFYMISFAIPVLTLLISMAIKQCYPFGEDCSTLIGDSRNQYIQFFQLLYDRIAEKKSFLFSWDTGMGFDFLSNFWYYMSNPCNWIVLLFGRTHIELGMICSILLQTGGCAVAFMYFLMHTQMNRIKTEKWNIYVCMLFSSAYALCDYILAYKYNLMWMLGLMVVPLIMLGTEYLVQKQDSRLYMVTLFLGFISNFYFAWFLCIWAVICFIEQSKENFKHWKKAFFRFVSSSVITALCAAFVLIPSFLAVLGRNNSNWYSISDFGIGRHDDLGNFINGFFWAHDLKIVGEDLFTQNNYCGIFVIVLSVVYFFNKNISRTNKIKRFSEIIFLVMAMNWIGLYWLMHGCAIPHMYTNRYAFMLIFLLLLTAFESLYHLDEIRFRHVGMVGLIMAVFYGFALFNSNLQDSAVCYLGTFCLILCVLIGLALFVRHNYSRNIFIIQLCMIGFVEILTNLFFSNADSVSDRTDAMKGTGAWMAEYDDITVESGERKTAFLISGQKFFAYSQTDIFASAIHSDLLKLFGKVGLSDGNAEVIYTYQGTTPLTSVLFNVRYVLTDLPGRFGGYSLSRQEDGFGVYEADNLVGLGYVLPENVLFWNLDDKNIFESQNNFSNGVLNCGNLFTEVNFEDAAVEYAACEVLSYENGVYHYINQDEEADRYASILLSMEIPENMDLYFYSKSTNRQSCNVYLDGELIYNDERAIQDDASTIHIGNVERGQILQILLSDVSSIQGEADIYVCFYQYHDDVMQEALAKMRESVYNIDTFEDTSVSGTVDAAKDGILYTSIPYYKGFTAYVDGKKTEIVKIGDAMTGVRVPAGKHTVEFRYFTYGLKTGIGLSIFGFLLVIINAVYAGKRKKNLET